MGGKRRWGGERDQEGLWFFLWTNIDKSDIQCHNWCFLAGFHWQYKFYFFWQSYPIHFLFLGEGASIRQAAGWLTEGQVLKEPAVPLTVLDHYFLSVSYSELRKKLTEPWTFFFICIMCFDPLNSAVLMWKWAFDLVLPLGNANIFLGPLANNKPLFLIVLS